MTLPPGIGNGYRIFRDDEILLRTFARVSVFTQAAVTVLFDDGGLANIPLQLTTISGSIVQDTSNRMQKDGWVVGCSVETLVSTKRGQLWAQVRIGSGSAVLGDDRQFVCQGYVYSEHPLTMGVFMETGPPEQGDKTFSILADDVAPVDIEHTLGVADTLRRIDGFIWYYHASSDVASRTLRVSARDFGLGLPTGMSSGSKTLIQVWPNAGGIVLTADEEGFIYVNASNGQNLAVSADDGVRTTEATFTTTPLPFPYWATEDDVGELFFDVGNANANDRHSIYLIQEGWVQI